MKKMFTLVVALMAFSALFAQRDRSYDGSRNDNRNTTYDNRQQHDYDMNNRPDHAVEMRGDDGRRQDYGHINNDDRRAEADRINNDYNRRIDDYRNNRSWDRDRQIDQLKRERAAKLKTFGGGILLGGVLGVIIGTQL